MASCPARICLAGEDLDWMGAPAILAAISPRVTVTISPIEDRRGVVAVEASRPFCSAESRPIRNVGVPTGTALDYVFCAVGRLADSKKLALESMTIHVDSDIPA